MLFFVFGAIMFLCDYDVCVIMFVCFSHWLDLFQEFIYAEVPNKHDFFCKLHNTHFRKNKVHGYGSNVVELVDMKVVNCITINPEKYGIWYWLKCYGACFT